MEPETPFHKLIQTVKNTVEATVNTMFSSSQPRVLKKGMAMRVVFFYPGEEGTYVDNVHVSVYENGIVNIESQHEETTTHIQNCEVLWNFSTEADEVTKIRLLKPKKGEKKGERTFELRGGDRDELRGDGPDQNV